MRATSGKVKGKTFRSTHTSARAHTQSNDARKSINKRWFGKTHAAALLKRRNKQCRVNVLNGTPSAISSEKSLRKMRWNEKHSILWPNNYQQTLAPLLLVMPMPLSDAQSGKHHVLKCICIRRMNFIFVAHQNIDHRREQELLPSMAMKKFVFSSVVLCFWHVLPFINPSSSSGTGFFFGFHVCAFHRIIANLPDLVRYKMSSGVRVDSVPFFSSPPFITLILLALYSVRIACFISCCQM